MRAAAPALLGALLGLGAFVPVAAAHGELVAADPAPNSSIIEAPPALTLVFTEPIDLPAFELELLDSRGTATGGLGAPESADGLTVTVALPPLAPDTYTVRYSVVSAADGHPAAGEYAFLLDPSGDLPPPSLTPDFSSPPVDPWGTAARAAALLAALALVGLHGAWITHRLRRQPPIRFPWAGSAVLAGVVVTGLGLYLARAAALVPPTPDQGMPFDVARAFGSTAFAQAMRLASGAGLAVLVVGLVATVARTDASRDGPWLAGSSAGTALIIIGMAQAGHAAALGGVGGAALDTLHLLGVGIWLGGIPAVALLLWRAGRAGSPVDGAWTAHGRLAMAAVPLVLATGLLNSALVLGDPRAVVASTTGNLLLLKATVLAAAAGLGAVNFLLVRRAAFGSVARLATVEASLGAVAVLAAALLVTGSPASAARPAEPDPSLGAAHLFGDAGTSRVHLLVDVPGPGLESYRATVTDPTSGADRTDVVGVVLSFHGPGSTTSVATGTVAPGVYGVRGIFTPVVGAWEITVDVQRSGTPTERVTFPITVLPEVADVELPPAISGLPLPAAFHAIGVALPSGTLGWVVPIGLFGVVALAGLAARRRRRAPWIAAAVSVVALLAVTSGLALVARDVVTATNRAPTAERERANPLAVDATILAQGERLYLANCASCHGTTGSGDGPLADATGWTPRALAASVSGQTDGELNWTLATGLAGTPMPAFGTTLLPYERWEIVSFLRQQWPARQGD